MPLIYEGRCSACAAVTPITSEGYHAVLVDEPATTYAHPDDPHLVILAHPCEALILEEIGYTYKAVTLGGRLVAVKNVFCRTCGQPFEIRRLTAGLAAFGCGGCLGVVAGAATAGIGVGILVGGDWVGYVAGGATFASLVNVAEASVCRFVRWRYADRAARVATPETCPSCGGHEHSRVGSRMEPLPCTACGQRAVGFYVVGMS